MKNHTRTSTDNVIERIFNAPRKLVWQAWSDPDHLQRWWGPKEFTAPNCTMDFREGGKYHFCMRSPDGKDYWSTGRYLEIKENERIVCTDAFSDENGNAVPASFYGFEEDWPLEMEIRVEFEDLGGKTKMTLTQSGIPEGLVSDQTAEGWNQSFDKLADSLK